MGWVITIDGPAASGKSSVSAELAARLGCPWVSTGAFYRGLAYCAKRHSVSVEDEQALADLALRGPWRVEMQSQKTRVFFEGEDVTEDIASEDLGSDASRISHHPKVREALLAAQRNCQRPQDVGLVAEGRDCGTVVFPRAEVKIYLTARSEARAERRAKELGLSAAATAQAQSERDQADQSRKTAPLQIPAEALVVDTSPLGFEEVVEIVENYAKDRLSQALRV